MKEFYATTTIRTYRTHAKWRMHHALKHVDSLKFKRQKLKGKQCHAGVLLHGCSTRNVESLHAALTRFSLAQRLNSPDANRAQICRSAQQQLR